MEEEVEEEYKAAATVDSRRACPSGCPRAVRGGVTATRRQAALGIVLCSAVQCSAVKVEDLKRKLNNFRVARRSGLGMSFSAGRGGSAGLC